MWAVWVFRHCHGLCSSPPGALTRCARWQSYRPIQEAGRSVSGSDVQRPWDQACGAYVAEWPTERPHSCFVGSCGASSVPAHPTFGTAGPVPSATGAGSAMEDAGAENTWQEDMDMLDASPTKSALVHEISHSVLEPAHIVLAVCRPDHTQLSQSLLHRITWHEADSAAQHELDKHLKGGADKLGNVLPLHMDA